MGKDVKIGLSVLAVLVGLLGYVCYHKFQKPSVQSSDAMTKLREKLAQGKNGAAQAAADMAAAAEAGEGGQPLVDTAASTAAANAWSGVPATGEVAPAQYAADATDTAQSGVAGAAWTIEDEPPVDGGQAGDTAAAPGDASPFGATGQAPDPAYADADRAAPGNEAPGDESPYGKPAQAPYDSDPAAAAAQGAALASEQFAPAEWSGGDEVAPAEPSQDGQPLAGRVDDRQPLASESGYDEPAAGYQQDEPLKFDEGDGAALADDVGAAAMAAGDAALQAADEALGNAAQAGQAQLDAIDDAVSTGGDVRLAAGQKKPAATTSQPHSLFQRAEEKLEELEHEVVDGVSNAAHGLSEEAHHLYDAATHRNAPHATAATDAGAGHDATAHAADPHAAPHAAAPYAPAHDAVDASGRQTHERDEYVVQPNENYWVISKHLYGTGAYFKALYELNRKQHPRADRLKTGDVIVAPSVDVLAHRFPDLCPTPKHHQALTQSGQHGTVHAVSQQHMPAGSRVYVVEEGDTLFDIARYELGKASRWSEIYDLNRQALGEDMDYLRPGTQLILPHAAGHGEEADAITQRPSDAFRR
jgi:nucleoid-associated protein YgaU